MANHKWVMNNSSYMYQCSDCGDYCASNAPNPGCPGPQAAQCPPHSFVGLACTRCPAMGHDIRIFMDPLTLTASGYECKTCLRRWPANTSSVPYDCLGASAGITTPVARSTRYANNLYDNAMGYSYMPPKTKPKSCECGSKSLGAKDYGPGHSSYCPVKG